MIKKFLENLDNIITPRDVLFLGLTLILFYLLRLPSLIEPYWYGDEGIYQVIGMAMNQGRVLYGEIWDNKPPVLYIIYALFNGDLFSVRFLSLIFGGLSVVVFFMLSKKLFKNQLSIYVSTFFYSIIFATPFLEGNIANSENFMLLPIISAFYLIYSTKEKTRLLTTFAAGIMISLAFLTKIVALFDFAALFITVLALRFYDEISFSKRKLKKTIRKIVFGFEQEAVLLIAFLSPVLLTAFYFLLMGVFPDFYRAVFSQNVGYVGHGNYLFFPMGFLYLKVLLLLFSILIILKYRKIFGAPGVLILTWLSFSIFNAMFSQRPYTHYLLVLLPSFSLFLGYILENKKLLAFTLPLAVILISVISLNFKFYSKIIPYYSNYLNFMMDKKSLEKYQSFFDRITPRDYEISRFIQAKTRDHEGIFLWSDSGQIYALSNKLPPGRYIVSYHITFYKEAINETKKALDRVRPKYIIQTKEGREVANFLDNYELRYKIGNVRIYERQS
ncbi:MAG: hypothetical protein UT56_C0016G0003 [Candidatus Levybacteria bacterium GW2011_GWB1_39_7]|nr:MAG: hypothetical protein UT56_C0016G0003 [Candidatus Levybacteria bacterium GW2011_GWB1_39_7]KKR27471.1 MAG: hypothetical protein UT57_C0004G0003 [Microgenomates group bacterium GW2011_GWC1_39_7]KKR48504.1 MAG: hypothetical protein UT85_C0029G0011 [Candidatus Levybacteria bacterium GW2011_GWA2_40_16]OGH15049.1 MAG: hypothetical protein A2689_01825 [Candidatus Levybacteria bacterium RIFCSPHIGHO2_01_FULL_38_96]OGH36092.1 MAG: hypothetical protein A3B43_00680 [Candidatus Levybacteria bacterium